LDVEKINEVIKDKEIEVYESEEILKINNKVLNYEETSKRQLCFFTGISW